LIARDVLAVAGHPFLLRLNVSFFGKFHPPGAVLGDEFLEFVWAVCLGRGAKISQALNDRGIFHRLGESL
jgi:hypothetical protein